MKREISVLEKERLTYHPKLPTALRSGNIQIVMGESTEAITDKEAIKAAFAQTYGQPTATIVEGPCNLTTEPLRVGVVLSGGQAPGGHNVIAGLYDAITNANPASCLFGFLMGPKGIIDGNSMPLTAEIIDAYRNTGGFDMIMSGRDKIETPEDLEKCRKNLHQMNLDGLVIIGGDDSNTNAVVLANYLKLKGSHTCVIGAPKTIDGDMKNRWIEASFGFDTAARVYSELIGNVSRDAASAVKYWHFIRLMGRSASHLALECALQTHPNVALISEEIQSKGFTLKDIVDQIVDVIIKRAAKNKHYGIVLVPEGLIEFIEEIRTLILEIDRILRDNKDYLFSLKDHTERVQYLEGSFSPASAKAYGSLAQDIQEVLLLRDKHGNVPFSQVETERLLAEMVADRIKELISRGHTDVPFSPLTHFFGYEGRCAAPSNFDADYGYSLGYTAAQLIRGRLTGYTVNIQNLIQPETEWKAGGTPTTMMLNMEERHGKLTPVIRKALVDLDGKPFKHFSEQRKGWAVDDAYVYPGPIQYYGPSEICDAPTITLKREQS